MKHSLTIKIGSAEFDVCDKNGMSHAVKLGGIEIAETAEKSADEIKETTNAFVGVGNFLWSKLSEFMPAIHHVLDGHIRLFDRKVEHKIAEMNRPHHHHHHHRHN